MWTRVKNKFYKYPALAIPVMIVLCLLIPLVKGLQSVISNPWAPLPPPPSRPERLLGTGWIWSGFRSESQMVIVGDNGLEYIGGHVYILAENGQVYAYDMVDRMWRESLEKLVNNQENCDHTLGQFLYLKRGQCEQGTEQFELGVSYHRFLLDRDGNLWYREDSPEGFFYFFVLFCAFSGLFAGMLVALILARLSRRKEKASGES